ncbi:sex determination protein fruitless-like isoform X2 [Thrips palmi]|uniref:Sex determination protein fruitless-like isoform X2 n=1 Tax=Thrips palmi TaxID=161013 RepID=A0A6P8ZX27_THRPL|nr:sex determination protein fruitless-like isoform X2 [Thrips palmi]
MADQQYCLRWNNHQNTLISVFDSLQERGCMVDCTLGAEGQSLQAHKVVLSACSPYLEDLLTKHYDKHPILILKDVRFDELKAMVDYMYRGEVNVAHDKLNAFLRAAESLQIKGLTDSGTDPPDTGGTTGGTKRTSKGAPVSVRSNQQLTVRSTNLADDLRDGSVSPSQRKRRRRRGSEESDNDSSSNVADGKQSSAAAAPVTGPSVLNQDMLPSVPASGPADALLSSIMESAETETATDSGIFAKAVTPSSQEIVIQDKGSSDVLIEPKTEYLDDDTQDLPLGDDDSVAGPSHSRSGNFMNDNDMFMADQDGSNNAQDVGFARVLGRARRTRRDRERPFRCAQCNASFTQKHHLKRHMAGHGVRRPYQCSQCTASFAIRDNLSRHLQTHSAQRPFRCETCGSGFRRKEHLLTHRRTHEGPLPWTCGVCAASFKHLYLLQAHQASRHPAGPGGQGLPEQVAADDPFKCPHCDATFRTPHTLGRHVRTHGPQV